MDASPVDEKTELDGVRGLFQLWWVKTRFTATQTSHMNSSCSSALLRNSSCWANMSVCFIPQWMSRIGPWLSSVQFSHSVMPDPLWPHGLQHARLPCSSPTPRAYSNSCPLSRWCHPTISSSVIPFSSHFQSFSASGSFQMSQFFASGGQSIGVSASVSVLPMNIQDWFPLEWTGWIPLLSKGLSTVFSNTTVQKLQLFSSQLSL